MATEGPGRLAVAKGPHTFLTKSYSAIVIGEPFNVILPVTTNLSYQEKKEE